MIEQIPFLTSEFPGNDFLLNNTPLQLPRTRLPRKAENNLLRIFIAGNTFPTTIGYPAVAQDVNSFYIIGGLEVDFFPMDTIYSYEPNNDSWTLLPNKMQYRRDGATAMIVKSSIFPSCK